MEHSDWYDNWPEELKALSFPTTIIPLTPEMRESIYKFISADTESHGANWWMNKLKDRVKKALLDYPDGAFVKLSSRSPKDNWDAIKKGFKVSTAQEVFNLLFQSERIMEDITLPDINLLIRKWQDMRPEDEWRCFQREGKFVGISQYFYNDVFRYPDCDLGEILQVAKKAHDAIKPYVPENIVFDLWIPALIEPEFRLIEINPWVATPFGTDPCLFEWKDLETATSLKFKYNRIQTADYEG